MSTGHTKLQAMGPPAMPGGRGDWQLASVPAAQHLETLQEVENGWKKKGIRRNGGGIGVEIMVGIREERWQGQWQGRGWKEEEEALKKGRPGRQPPRPSRGKARGPKKNGKKDRRSTSQAPPVPPGTEIVGGEEKKKERLYKKEEEEEEMKEYLCKKVAIDWHGTMADNDNMVSEDSLRALEKLLAKGIKATILSYGGHGRNAETLRCLTELRIFSEIEYQFCSEKVGVYGKAAWCRHLDICKMLLCKKVLTCLPKKSCAKRC